VRPSTNIRIGAIAPAEGGRADTLCPATSSPLLAVRFQRDLGRIGRGLQFNLVWWYLC